MMGITCRASISISRFRQFRSLKLSPTVVTGDHPLGMAHPRCREDNFTVIIGKQEIVQKRASRPRNGLVDRNPSSLLWRPDGEFPSWKMGQSLMEVPSQEDKLHLS